MAILIFLRPFEILSGVLINQVTRQALSNGEYRLTPIDKLPVLWLSPNRIKKRY
jgi:hypothetical protein